MPIKLLKSDIKDKIDNPAPGYMILGFDERGQLVWKDEDGAYGTIVPSVAIGNYEILEIGNYLTVGFRLTTIEIGLYSIAQGNDVAASGLSSYAQGTDAIAQGDYSTAKGEYVEAKGTYSYVSGKGQLTGNKLTSGGLNSFVHSYADTISGTWSDYSVILGGQNHNISDDSHLGSNSSYNSVIIGGDTNSIGYLAHNSGIIGGNYNSIDNEVENTIIIGGNSILATKSNSVYVPRLVLKNDTYTDIPVGGTIEYDNVGGINHFKGYINDTGTFAYLDGVYASLLSPTLAMLNPVGGFGIGTTVGSITGTSFINMFDRLLFPVIYPTYWFESPNIAPFNRFTKNVSTIQIVGANVPITLTNTYVIAEAGNTAGKILLNGAFQNNRGGVALSYNRSGPGVSDVNDPSSSTTFSHTIVVGTAGNTWIGSTNYDVGPQPKDNTNTNYQSPYPAGTTAAPSVNIEGVYVVYATTSSNTPTAQTPISMSTNPVPNSTIPNGGYHLIGVSSPNKQIIEIPTAWTNFPVNGIRWFNSVYQTWDYEGGSQGSSLLNWTLTDVTHGGIPYKRYSYNNDMGDRYWYFEMT